MSSKNIFEVLQKIAENPESNEKFLNILKENGFTGTLEEAENQINQQTQVVLNNLTTEDLQNIAGGKSLMNDKLKKALAVGGASLMAAGTGMPSSLAGNKNNTKKFANKAVTYVKDNPVHTGVTGTFALATVALLVKSIFGDRPVVWYDLSEKDLSTGQVVCGLINQCALKICEITVCEKDGKQFLKIKLKDDLLKDELWNDENTLEYTVDGFLLKLAVLMDGGLGTYVNNGQTLTPDGAKVLNESKDFILSAVSYAAIAGETNENDDEEQSSSQASSSSSSDEMKEEVVVDEDIKKKKDADANKMTMLNGFVDNLVQYANTKLDEVNNIAVSSDDNNAARRKFVTDLTDQNAEQLNTEIAAIENLTELKQDGTLTDDIINEVRTVIVTELDKVAKLAQKPENVDENKNTVKNAIDKMFEGIRKALEEKVQPLVVEKDENVPVENESKKQPVIRLRTRRKFKSGDPVNSEKQFEVTEGGEIQ